MPEILGRRERTGYALTMTRNSLKGGGWAWAYGNGNGVQRVPVTDSLLTRLRNAPRTFRSSLAAITEEKARRTASDT